ncbi:uncharacterized protein LOC134842581 isoform X3 [Symsagittifera roscoffensis]|uniref:uncharacterized protein LOC134842581 isoform X3 n=1 Tax=Symsagittifera roscoffensis TaxID=84072 RepID=UPI00307B5690
MDVIIEFLNPDIRSDFLELSKSSDERSEKSISTLNSLLRKSLMESVKQKSKQKLVEIETVERGFDREKASAILEFLKIKFDSLASVLHSDDLVTSLVHDAVRNLYDWGKSVSKEELIEKNKILSAQTKTIQEHQARTKKKGKNEVQVRKTTSSVATKSKSSDSTGVENLSEILINQLKIFKVHTGQYVKGQLIGHPCVTTGVTHLMQDKNGSVTILGIYNLMSVQKNEEFEEIYPVKSWILVKEPFFKIFDSGDKGIRIDDPRDILLCTEELERRLTPTKKSVTEDSVHSEETVKALSERLAPFRTKGNQLFVQKKFELALAAYWEGIIMAQAQLHLGFKAGVKQRGHKSSNNEKTVSKTADDDDEFAQLLKAAGLLQWEVEKDVDVTHLRLSKLTELGLLCSNISICLKELNCHHKAAIFARLVQFFDVSPNIKHKSLFRYWQCQLVSGHLKSLGSGTWNHLKDVLSKHEIASLKLLEAQASSGTYDWDKIVEQYLNGENQHYEVADFIGNVEFREIQGKGLGTLATKDIEKGELVMASKALQQTERNLDQILTDTVAPELILSGPQSKLVRDIKIKAKEDFSLNAKLRGLYAGSKFNRIPTRDMIEMTQSQNVQKLQEELSAEQIGYAVKFNAFGSNSGTFVKHKNGQLPPNTLSNSTFAGLWFEPSFFNHDDNPNVCWAVMGNLLVARAATKIKAGEELTITYSCELRITERKNTLKDYGFNYDLIYENKQKLELLTQKSEAVSELILQSQNTKNEQHRVDLLNRAIKLNNSVIRDHYSRISDLQPLVMGFLYDQMQLYLATKHERKAKETAIKILDFFPCYVNEDLLQTILTSFSLSLNPELLESLQKCVKLIYGTNNISLFY